ncbi:MAG TPA: DUF1588 domain-containing protein, partial [Polyangiaceae bacterium]|nr:DUF1588 domain-containing protein [Polyangiaceae bacterium]
MKRPLSSMLCFLVLGTALGCGDNSNVVGSGGSTGAAGDNDGSSGSSNPSGGEGGSAGKGGTGGSGGGSAGSDTSEAGAGPIGGEGGSPAVVDCLQGATFEPADGPYASMEVVWERITTIINGTAQPVPIGLSAEITADEAATLAGQIFDGAVQSGGAPVGLRRFLDGWLSITDATTLSRDWAALVCEDGNSLETLLALPDEDEPERVGIFSDPVWLENKPGITGRGGRMVKAFGTGDLGALTVPPDTGPTDPQQPDETRREWLARSVAPANCITCHEILDPWGHALEHFDQLGQYRDTDNGQPVDAS